MHFAKVFLFATVAVASVIERRDFATVFNDIKTITADTKVVTAKAKAYNGNINDAVAIQTAANNLDSAIKQATTDAGNSPVATTAQAKQLIAYINKNLIPATTASVNAIIAKKAQFASNGLTGSVKSTFQTLKTDSDKLGAALLAKTPSAQKSAANAAQAKIDAQLTRGINAFS